MVVPIKVDNNYTFCKDDFYLTDDLLGDPQSSFNYVYLRVGGSYL